MKRVFIITMMCLLLAGVVQAKDYALKAQWDRSIETDISHYVLYRTDSGSEVVVPACSHVNQLPSGLKMECPFTVTIADGTEVTMSFIINSVDTSTNISPDSDPATYRADAKPGTKVGGFVIMLQ